MPFDRRRILFEDEDLLAVAKRSGELVVRAKGGAAELPLVDYLREEICGPGETLTVLHRLDRETSGVILFAKSRRAFREAIDQRKFSGAEKRYRTIVAGAGLHDRGVVEASLPSRTTRALVPARSEYTVLERFTTAAYVEVLIRSGRHHQIRRHLCSLGYPLVLDRVYGDAKVNRAFERRTHFHKFFLHAYSLAFDHFVTGERVAITAPLPHAFEEVLVLLREETPSSPSPASAGSRRR